MHQMHLPCIVHFSVRWWGVQSEEWVDDYETSFNICVRFTCTLTMCHDHDCLLQINICKRFFISNVNMHNARRGLAEQEQHWMRCLALLYSEHREIIWTTDEISPKSDLWENERRVMKFHSFTTWKTSGSRTKEIFWWNIYQWWVVEGGNNIDDHWVYCVTLMAAWAGSDHTWHGETVPGTPSVWCSKL